MAHIAIPILSTPGKQDVEIEVTINGLKQALHYRVALFYWEVKRRFLSQNRFWCPTRIVALGNNRFSPMRPFFVIAALLLSTQIAARCQVLTARQAYEYLQNERHRAGAAQGEGEHPPGDSLRKAESILQNALAYYAKPDISELAKTDKALFFRKSDLLFDLAAVQSKLGQTNAAVASLRQILAPEFEGIYAKWVAEEPAFALARQDSSIKPILEKAAALDNVFNSKSLSTPYRPNLSEDEKVAGLSKLWSEAKYNFAYFDHLPGLDWDQGTSTTCPKSGRRPARWPTTGCCSIFTRN